MEVVTSKHKKGCAVACMAMLLGTDYDTIERQFEQDFDKHATPWEAQKNFLGDHGCSLIEKKCSHWEHKDFARKEMLKPFAPVHLLSVKPFADSKVNHAIVMDGKGKLYDPSGHTDEQIRQNVYLVEVTLGIYPSTT